MNSGRSHAVLTLLALLASSAAAESVPPACAARLDQQTWIFAGTGDHVYYGDELSGRWMTQPWADALRLVPSFAEVAAALKTRGTTLVLAPVPPRTFLEGAALDRQNPTEAAFDPAAARAFYQKFGQSLRAAGVPTADLLGGASTQDTFDKDIHWTPQGAATAARSVAEVVRGLPVYPALAHQDFVTLPTGAAARFESDQPVIAKARDLCGLALSPDRYQTETTVPAGGLPATTGNFGEAESGPQRWAFGPVATVAFALPSAGPVTLHLAFVTPVAGQEVSLGLNGTVLDTLTGLAGGATTDRTYTLAGRAGTNRLDFGFTDWNGRASRFAPDDARPMAVAVKALTLSAGGQQADLVSPQTDSSALLGHSAPEVTLVGASSSMSLLNFDGALKQALGTDVQNVSYGAAGVFNSLKDYLRDPAYQQSPPRVLVWQFPLIGGDATFNADFRDVLAAVQGHCESGQAQVANGGSGGLEIGATAVPASARLHVWADDQALRSVKVTMGTEPTLELVNSPRMLKQGEFYAALGNKASTPLKLSWPAGINGQVHAEVCAVR
ncbi:alginate O-acetyltransferase AlgX-related protein [Deinococcus sp.]|uniref:alginate O-acetyltransferase AlgX-related protein n=1 Tax=Deinococcus sp. TaxID=47478 RepID=UPI003C7D6AEA